MWPIPARARVVPALFLAGVVVLTACGGGGGKAKAPTPTTVKINSSVALRFVSANVASAGPAVAFPADLRNKVSQSVNRYVEAAVVSPLRAGAVGAGLAGLFTPDAAAKLNGPERATLTDEGVPKLSGSITPTTAAFALTGLAEKSGDIVLVSANLKLDLHAAVPGGDLHMVRQGTLLFSNVAGAWRVAGFDLSVIRNGPGVQVALGHAKAEPSA
jgi:hypothetical protein